VSIVCHDSLIEIPWVVALAPLAYNLWLMTKAQARGRRRDRPRSVTLIAWGVLLLGLLNGWRALGLLRQRSLLEELGVIPNPVVASLIALLWAALFVVLAVVVWQGRPVTRLLVPVILLIYALYQLLLIALFAQSGRSRGDLLGNAGIYAVVLLITTWALNRRSARVFFLGE
jgi:hypothetical protein